MNKLGWMMVCLVAISGWSYALISKPKVAYIDMPRALAKPARMLSKTNMKEELQTLQAMEGRRPRPVVRDRLRFTKTARRDA